MKLFQVNNNTVIVADKIVAVRKSADKVFVVTTTGVEYEVFRPDLNLRTIETNYKWAIEALCLG